MDGRAGVGALALVALLWGAGVGAAEPPGQSLALSPPTVDLTHPPLVPGEVRVARLTVYGSGDQEMDVTASGAEPAGAWITAFPSSFHLPVGGSQEVTLRIDVPKDAAKGVHLGRIDFTPAPPAAGNGTSQVQAGVSGLLDISVDPTVVHALAVDAMRVANIHLGDPLPLEVDVRNTGNVQDAYRLELAVFDADRDGVLLRTSFDAAPLTAGDRRTDTFNASAALAEGQYAYDLTATLAATSKVLRVEQGLFQVAAPGAQFKLGALPFLTVAPANPREGQEVRLAAPFRNEGAVAIGEARFVGTILRDGEAVGSIATPAAAVPALGNLTLLGAYVPERAGAYLIRGHVVFDGLRTEEQEAAFEVAAPGGLLRFLPGWAHVPPWLANLLGLLLSLIGLLGLLGLWRRSRRRERKPKPVPVAAKSDSLSGSPAWLRSRPDALAAAPAPTGRLSRGWWWFFRSRTAILLPARVPEAPQRSRKPWLARAAAWLRRAPGRLRTKVWRGQPTSKEGQN